MKEIRTILASSSGIKLIDDTEKSGYPVPLNISGQDEVYVGRLRKNPALKMPWICG
jgi:aspartate-semialdehyde dehydrogenase